MFLRTDAVIPSSHNLMLWVGQLTEEELHEYIHEPGGRIDGAPQSKFAQDLLRFYDHDFLWAVASSTATSIQELAVKLGVRDAKLVEELENRVQGVGPLSCFLILWNYRNLRPLAQPFANGKLRFVGSWAHQSPYADD